MFEKGYYLCKKDADTQEINYFINAVFSNSERYAYRDRNIRWLEVADVGRFTAGRIYYSEGGQIIRDDNCIPVSFSKDSTSGFGYKFEKVEVDMTEVEPLMADLNKKLRFVVKMHPYFALDGKVVYVCEITNGNVCSMAMGFNPKSVLYSAQKSFREKINETTKTYKAYMRILNKDIYENHVY